jgi:hypothetical protein
MPKAVYPFEAPFKELVPDLSVADADGWSTGTCPYCREPGAFRVNLVSGRWVCLPQPDNAGDFPPPDRVVGTRCGRDRIDRELDRFFRSTGRLNDGGAGGANDPR